MPQRPLSASMRQSAGPRIGPAQPLNPQRFTTMPMIPCHYSINVAKATGRKLWPHAADSVPEYRHLFATSDSLQDRAPALAAYDELTKAFPAPAYSVTMDYVECHGEPMNQARIEAMRAELKAR